MRSAQTAAGRDDPGPLAVVYGSSTQRPDECLHHPFERMVRRQPAAAAVVFGDDRLTYRELDGAAERIACALAGRGVACETLVGIALERSLALVPALLGIAKSGAAFVPLDASAPPARLDAVLRDAAPALVITDAATAPAFAACGRPVVTVEELLAGDAVPLRRAGAVRPDGLAYVVYTSGSTGVPKGVMVEHCSAANTIVSAIGDFDVRPYDRVLQLAPLTFDPSVWQIFGTLAAGACIVLPPSGAQRDPDAIAQAVRLHAVTVVDAVPPQWSALDERGCLARLPSLRVAVSGGAALPPALSRRFRELGIPLYNAYGPTEAAVQATVGRCTAADDDGFVALGEPIDNTSLYLLDADLQPVRAGAAGEIYLGGSGVARGYLHAPELTARMFLPDPFAGRTGARMYRTGDLARFHPDGRLEFLGRGDEQVKVRGVRVELGDVAAALQRHPRVADAVAIATGPDKDRIVAFVVPRDRRSGMTEAMRAHVREALDAAGRPAAIHVVGALPQLPSGKHDRRALLELSARLARIERLSEPPDSLYALVLHLWEDVLGVRGIGLGESFFDVGGHSLLAVRLRARVEERVGRSVPLEVFFADPTIAGMVRALRAGERASIAPLLALSTSGAKQPLFFLHGDPSGLGLYCRTFAPSLGAERPIYAIAPHGTDGGNVPATIEEMARDQIALIRERRPHGPYLIGGYCMGAIVAFEIARQLEQAGETVTHLILIEAQSARPRFGFVEDAVTGAARFSGLSEDACRRWLARRRFEVQAALRYVRRRPAPTADAEVDNTARVLTAQQDAVHRYVWRSLRTSATLICAQEEPNANVGAVRLMWRSLLSALEVRLVPGNHKTALGAHIDVLTAAFAQIFERLDV